MRRNALPLALILVQILSPIGHDAQAASNVTSIDFRANGAGGGEIVISADGPVQVEKVENSPDNQVVLNISGAQLTKYATRKLDASSFDGPVSLISPYQLQDVPDTARIVVQLRETVSSDLSQQGNTIRLSLGAGSGSGSPAPTTAANASVDAAPVAAPAAASSEEAPAAQSDRVSKSSAAASGGVQSKSRLEQFFEARETKRYYGKPVTIRVKEMDLADVFRLIGETSGFNIVLGEDVKGKITLSLEDVPWDQALDLVLSTQRLGAERNNNVLRVVTLANLTTEKQEQLKAKQASEASTPRVTRVFPISFAKPAELSGLLSKLGTSQSGTTADTTSTIQVDERTNSLIVRDTIENIERMKKLIEVLDTQTPQVLIETKVIEATERFSNGLSGTLTGQMSDPFGMGFSFNGLSTGALGNSITTGNSQFATSFGILPNAGRLNAALSINEAEDKIKIISAPRTVVLDKQTAQILKSDPLLQLQTTVSNGVQQNTFVNTPATLSLRVQPTVTNDGSVLLDLNVSRDVIVQDPNGATATGSRNMTTKVLVESGATLVIGGIYSSNNTERENGFPFLRKIPVIGALFGSETSSLDRSELFIFVTPRILNPKEAGLAG
jgi:type IV pilus assembly protein PilQ